MITPRAIVFAALAASFAILPAPASARGGGMHGRAGTATTHPPTIARAAVTPAPTQTQTAAAVAAAVAAASITSSVTSPPAVSSSALPPSALAAPAPQATAVAPLSPPPATLILGSGGGPVQPATTASSTPSSASPSESAPSSPGGGGDTLAACMGFWDAGTHMTKIEWRSACTRTLNRIDLTTPVPGTPPTPAQHHATAVVHRQAPAR